MPNGECRHRTFDTGRIDVRGSPTSREAGSGCHEDLFRDAVFVGTVPGGGTLVVPLILLDDPAVGGFALTLFGTKASRSFDEG
jgi:hypothetical protein